MREIAGEHILVPIGAAAKKFQGIITVNASGLILWNKLQSECTEEMLVTALTAEYEVDAETAAADVARFLSRMRQAGILVENG